MSVQRIYFDNAATTPMLPEVKAEMNRIIENFFGNPSSIHSYGRESRTIIERSRKTISTLIHCAMSEIIFTSCGTEANNTVFYTCINDLGVKHIITSPLEHHSVLHTLKMFEEKGLIKISFVDVDDKGKIQLPHLETLLQNSEPSLVSLMHANNEISNLLPIKNVSELCRKYDALLHVDMVQTFGHYQIDFRNIDVDFASCSAHKFHGPKGIGLLYVNQKTVRINPLLHGGGQERDMRSGTENIYAIAGMAKAFEMAYLQLDNDIAHIQTIKNTFVEKIKNIFPSISFLGESENKGLYTILSVMFPIMKEGDMLIMNLDMSGIAASSGSACASGTNHRSHVLDVLKIDNSRPVIRFSFSKLNTLEEVDRCIDILAKFAKQ